MSLNQILDAIFSQPLIMPDDLEYKVSRQDSEDWVSFHDDAVVALAMAMNIPANIFQKKPLQEDLDFVNWKEDGF